MEKIKKIPIHVWILAVIILVGLFLRTYNLHSWLKFRVDQVHDASLVDSVLAGKTPWPMMGPFMSHSGDGTHVEANSFHLGPIYYYFQIISAKIFGNYADKLAYPDVFFGVLTIPLLYLFLRIYFKRETSLAVAGLFAISSYFVQYSRFAWNTNLIPFFVLLFLFTLHKFLEKNEKTPWKWVILLGIAFGVGVQLHAILILLFTLVAFFVFLFSMSKNIGAWKKWIVILMLVCILNAPQIFSEIKTNFSNAKIFLHFSAQDKDEKGNFGVNKLNLIKNDLDCNIEANAYFLSAYGSSSCDYNIFNPATYGKVKTKNLAKFLQFLIARVTILAGFAFSIFGYYLLIKYRKREAEESKQYFLNLIMLYVSISFLIMLPLSVDEFNDLRYLTPTFFVPYILLAFLAKFISEEFSKKYSYIILGMFSLLIATNIFAIARVASSFFSGNRTCDANTIIMGELEPVAEYISSDLTERKLIYLGGDKTFEVVYRPLSYILKKRGVAPMQINEGMSLAQDNIPIFMVSCRGRFKDEYSYKKIGSIFVYRLNN